MMIKNELIDPSEELLPLPMPQSNSNINRTARTTDKKKNTNNDDIIISISDSDFDSDSDSDDYSSIIRGSPLKRQKIEAILPVGFLDPLPPEERLAMQQQLANSSKFKTTPSKDDGGEKLAMPAKGGRGAAAAQVDGGDICVKSAYKQFWKAGDYDGTVSNAAESRAVGMDHLRVHPRFLHSNATSHKWALGAFAELLDNALDEVSNGATYVHVDMVQSKKDKSAMLVIEDNGGGMTPDKIRQCMSLGYSEKSKLTNTIGQYGNGFKTSTMRLGADVIVFTRCHGKDKKSATQSIGMLSYTFLRKTGKEDIVVPMIDYEKRGKTWSTMPRSTFDDWKRNLETIVQWTPYEGEEDLLEQFDYLKEQGTRIVIYNLWEDDQGQPELDFVSDQYDMQIRGVNRDEKKIAMAKDYPNSRHFLTYRHSLRNYASILYLRLPPCFRIILRGKDVEHHNIVNDMMHSKEITYRPIPVPDEAPKDPNMFALLTLGFVKDAAHHIDVQGFNVYHKNRLIKPFWRVWNAAGSDGRGVIGVLEANFVEPAHDKQSFERTIVFSRLEARLIHIQKNYWSTNCHLIGYAKRRNKNSISPERKATASVSDQPHSHSNSQEHIQDCVGPNIHKSSTENAKRNETGTVHDPKELRSDCKGLSVSGKAQPNTRFSAVKLEKASRHDLQLVNADSDLVVKLREENQELKDGLEDILHDLQSERDRNRLLENQLEEKENILTSLLQERSRRETEEGTLRNKLKGAADTIEDLCNKVKLLQQSNRAFHKCKSEK